MPQVNEERAPYAPPPTDASRLADMIRAAQAAVFEIEIGKPERVREILVLAMRRNYVPPVSSGGS